MTVRHHIKRYALAAGALLLIPAASFACTCLDETLWPGGRPVKEQVRSTRKESSAVFSGFVTRIDFNEATHTYEAHFTVYESWKGVRTREVSVFGATVLPCTYTFRTGETYLVYATRRNKYLEASFCPTKILRYADEDRKFLGKGKRFNATAKHNKSLDASGGSLFLNLIRAAMLE